MRGNHSSFKLITLLISASLAWICLVQNAGAQTSSSTPVMRAVLFYRSTCEHCQQLMAEVKPPLLDRYRNQLQVFYCDISKPEGDALFTSAIQQYGIKTIGVPTVIVGDNVLIGSINIQETFPKIIDGLSRGGLGWPEIPGLDKGLAASDSMNLPAITAPSEFLPHSPSLISTPAFGGITNGH
jgi:thiol-disulfide isomerase/thioredoxin